MTRTADGAHDPPRTDVLWDGFTAGALGAVAVALWFLVLDIAAGHPLRTPTVLGTTLFAGPEAAATVEHAEQTTVILYSAVHLAAFVVLGTLVAWIADRFRNRSWAVPLLVAVFALFEVGVYLVLLVSAPPVAEELSAWRILVGNLLAVAIMAAYLVLRHPRLVEERRAGFGRGREA